MNEIARQIMAILSREGYWKGPVESSSDNLKVDGGLLRRVGEGGIKLWCRPVLASVASQAHEAVRQDMMERKRRMNSLSDIHRIVVSLRLKLACGRRETFRESFVIGPQQGEGIPKRLAFDHGVIYDLG